MQEKCITLSPGADTEAFQAALDRAAGGVLRIPAGEYCVERTLYIDSDTQILADENARIRLGTAYPKKRGDFLLSNRHTDTGDRNIFIAGGVWDGGFDGVVNTKSGGLFDEDAWSGVLLNFTNVRNLILRGLTLANSVTYYLRLCRIDGFDIRYIRFAAERLAFNQDGLHFAGECRNGYVKDIRAVTRGETNDDMIALNADDSTVRRENFDTFCGPIENITFEDIFAEDCYTAVRMLSVRSPIRNIRFKNLVCGCRVYAINMDGARYCATPLFSEAQYPQGCGQIEHILFDGLTVYSTGGNPATPLIDLETRCTDFVIRDFSCPTEREALHRPLLRVKNLPGFRAELYERGKSVPTPLSTEDKETLELDQPFDGLVIS